MMYAVDCDGQRARPQPHQTARCELCGGEVIAKCGQVNVWHWAHRDLEDCDGWAEPLTEWHLDWQEQFPPGTREVTAGAHRADIRMPSGLVIEFQHSALSVDEIREREDHYGWMAWVFDEVDAYEDDRLSLYSKDDGTGRHRSFRWKHPRRSILWCRRPVLLDLGDGMMLALKKMHPRAPYGGWGYLRSREEFFDYCHSSVRPAPFKDAS